MGRTINTPELHPLLDWLLHTLYLTKARIPSLTTTTRWVIQYPGPVTEHRPYHDKWGLRWHLAPQGMGSKERRHSTTYPDLSWARQVQQSWRQPGNMAHSLWGADAMQARPSLEDPAALWPLGLLEERPYSVMGRFQPSHEEAYMRMIAGRYAFKKAPLYFPVNPVRVVTRWTGADTGAFSAPFGQVLGWGGVGPIQIWSPGPGSTSKEWLGRRSRPGGPNADVQ